MLTTMDAANTTNAEIILQTGDAGQISSTCSSDGQVLPFDVQASLNFVVVSTWQPSAEQVHDV